MEIDSGGNRDVGEDLGVKFGRSDDVLGGGKKRVTTKIAKTRRSSELRV